MTLKVEPRDSPAKTVKEEPATPPVKRGKIKKGRSKAVKEEPAASPVKRGKGYKGESKAAVQGQNSAQKDNRIMELETKLEYVREENSVLSAEKQSLEDVQQAPESNIKINAALALYISASLSWPGEETGDWESHLLLTL